jgi:hypothetical protein
MALNYKSPYLKLLIFFCAFSWFCNFARAIIPPYLLKLGLSTNQIILGAGLAYLGQFLIMIVFSKKIGKNLSAYLSWRLALVCFSVYLLLIINLESVYQYYLASFFNGFTTFLFFVYYNTAHFKNTADGKTSHSSALMFSVGPMISVFAPLAAGIAAEYKYNLVWFLSGIFLLIPYFLIKKQQNFKIKRSLSDSFREIKSTRIFIFIEGIWESLIFGIIPIYTLFFLKTPLNYTTFIAYLAFISVLANLLLGRFSDKVQKRAIFIYPITILLAGATFIFPLATTNLVYWIIATGIVQFMLPMFWNISTAMVVDSHSDLGSSMFGREIMLTSGRIIGMTVAILSFSLEKTPFYIFFFLGTVMIFYPMVLFWRAKIKKHYSYI